MNTKDFMDYVSDQFRQGLNRTQVAASLGMTLDEFTVKCEEIYGLRPKNDEAPQKPITKQEPVVKPVSGAEIVKEKKPLEDNFMNEPILGKDTDEEVVD